MKWFQSSQYQHSLLSARGLARRRLLNQAKLGERQEITSLLHGYSDASIIAAAEGTIMKAIYIFAFSSVAFASTILVPGDYTTISEAITASVSGDSILVSHGCYQEEINYSGKEIAIIAVEGPEITVIIPNPQSQMSVVSIVNGEGPGTVLEGFMISNGSAVKGGGIRIIDSSPLILNNIILNNEARNSYNAYGGGIYIEDSSPVIVGNHIYDNLVFSFDMSSRFAYGGGIYAEDSYLTILNNRIESNDIQLGSSNLGFGAGLCLFSCSGMIANNIIAYNEALHPWADGVGIWASNCDLINNTIVGNDGLGIKYSSSVMNCIVWANNLSGTQIETSAPATYSNVMYGYTGEGNISILPEFVPGPLSSFHLDTPVSPCIDAGNPSPEFYDPEDTPGIALWPALGTVTNDMGAYGGPGAAFWTEGYTSTASSSSAPVSNSCLQISMSQNPVDELAVVNLSLLEPAHVKLQIYDASGRTVFSSSNQFAAGNHALSTKTLPAGMYCCRATAGIIGDSVRFVVLR